MNWKLRLKHWFSQAILRRKVTCTYCVLACEPQYGGLCEICEMEDQP